MTCRRISRLLHRLTKAAERDCESRDFLFFLFFAGSFPAPFSKPLIQKRFSNHPRLRMQHTHKESTGNRSAAPKIAIDLGI